MIAASVKDIKLTYVADQVALTVASEDMEEPR